MVKVSNSVYSMKLLHGTSFSEVFAEAITRGKYCLTGV